jgi:TRAP-type C4-dicarboxylate transport system substrate-binding protein
MGEEKSAISVAASAMGKKRWADLSEDERKAAMEKARSERQRQLSKARRREIASTAAKARWAKARAAKQADETADEPKPKLSGGSGARGKRKL